MFQKIIHFVKYNNAFTIGIMAIFLGAGMSFAASPDLRNSVYESKDVVTSVDNYKIVSADLDNFNFNLKINSVTEDDKDYYVGYSYKTLSIQNATWGDTDINKTLTVSKESLGEKDLGLYVANELGDNIKYELSYLKEVQKLQKDAGVSKKVITTEYSGLVGKLLDPKEKVIEGYSPVIPEIVPEVVSEPEKPVSPDPSLFIENTPGYQAPDVNANSNSSSKTNLDASSVRQIVEDMLTEYQKQKSTPTPEPTPTPELPTLTGGQAGIPTSENVGTAPAPTLPTPVGTPTPVGATPAPVETPPAPPAETPAPAPAS